MFIKRTKRAPDWKKPATRKQLFLQKKNCLKNEEIRCITNKSKTKKGYEWMGKWWFWYSSNFINGIKQFRSILFPYLSVNLVKQNKFISIKRMVLASFKNTMYRITIPLIKLQNLTQRKKHIVHHRTPNCIWACILPHACWKSPDRACPLIFENNNEVVHFRKEFQTCSL